MFGNKKKEVSLFFRPHYYVYSSSLIRNILFFVLNFKLSKNGHMRMLEIAPYLNKMSLKCTAGLGNIFLFNSRILFPCSHSLNNWGSFANAKSTMNSKLTFSRTRTFSFGKYGNGVSMDSSVDLLTRISVKRWRFRNLFQFQWTGNLARFVLNTDSVSSKPWKATSDSENDMIGEEWNSIWKKNYSLNEI